MGGETEAAWRHDLEDLLGRGLKAPELLIVDGGKGLEAALASLWSDIPVQRCTVHKERNLLAHAPKALHDEVKADYTDMMYAENAEQVRKKRKALELLSTVHWVVSREGAKSGDEVLAHTYAWGDRKRRFSPRQIHLTFDVLVKK